jgi:hypothetical protein
MTVPKSSWKIWTLLINLVIAGKSTLTKGGKKGMISLYNYACSVPVLEGDRDMEIIKSNGGQRNDRD